MLEETYTTPFFRRVDWGAFWTALTISFLVYFYTLAPTVTLEDSGELAVAADWLGVPHPPGYPIWTMLCWLATKIFSFVTFRGQPNPAWSVGLVSAIFGALTAAITAMLICRSGSDMLRNSKQISRNLDSSSENAICWISGVVCSLLLAFAPIMWSQAVIVEVYSLNAYFLVQVLLLVYMWTKRPSSHLLYITAFVFGLGLTNYQVLLLAALALAIVIMLKDFELFRDFLIAVIPIGLVLGLAFNMIHIGNIIPIKHPGHISFFVYLSLNCLILISSYFFLPRGKTVSITILLAELGVAFYVYMPIVSDLRNPPMNWGYPRTWEGFKHALSRGQYEKINPTDVFSMRFIHQIGTYLSDLTLNFTIVLTLVGFLPFSTWKLRVNRFRFSALPVAALLIGLSALLYIPLFRNLVIPLPGIGGITAYKAPALFVVCLLAVGAIATVLGRLNAIARNHIFQEKARMWEKTLGILILAGVAGLYYLRLLKAIIDARAPLHTGKALSEAAQNGISQQCQIIALIMLIPIILGAGIYIWHRFFRNSAALELTIDEDSQKWMFATLVAFATLSIGLIVLANLKMDIQDTFIQRVKFISSHLLFAFWIGYGLIFLLTSIDRMAPENFILKTLSIVCVAVLPLLPIHKNWKDTDLLKVYGGAEQNGHDFGWQFGNYQLRGAAAIIEELDPEEEPIPNPSYPPDMGTNAVFFGGTDPGRFVPTYMIYSARVREDVFLITQNALADNTYMSVMRDLYGNDIWIPSVTDSAKAFQTYVHEIETGKRPETAGIKKENGRVQISGVLGVMEINGILAKQIFDYNNYKHDFFVEESYVIRWMYPYLEPHGLIMRINQNKHSRLPGEMSRNDLDFWDWYTRRLTNNEKFARDIVARKSFSKLRSAIAGLYAFRGMKSAAETAFGEARQLYPLSPEANFRLAEVHMRSKEFKQAQQIIREFSKQDPANTKAESFLKQLKGIEALHAKIAQLEKESPKGQMDIRKALQMADLYRQAGMMGKFNSLAGNILANKNLPTAIHFQLAQLYQRANKLRQMSQALDLCIENMPKDTPPTAYLKMAQMYNKAQNPQGMRKAIQKYLKHKPKDWKAWLDLASLEAQLKNRNEVSAAIRNAIRYGGAEAEKLVAQNPLLRPYQIRTTIGPQNNLNGLINLGL